MAKRGRRTEREAAREQNKIFETGSEKFVKTVSKMKKHRWFQRGLLALLLALILGAAVYCIWDRVKDETTMGCRILVDQVDVSHLSIEEAADKIESQFGATRVAFTENDKEIYTTSLSDAGYTIDRSKLISELTKIKEERQPCRLFFEREKSLHTSYQITWDDKIMTEAFSGDRMDNGSERLPSSDAYIQYNSEDKRFEIIPSVTGNEIDNGKLLNLVQETLNGSFSEGLIEKK